MVRRKPDEVTASVVLLPDLRYVALALCELSLRHRIVAPARQLLMAVNVSGKMLSSFNANLRLT
jgi:hypothetical protein